MILCPDSTPGAVLFRGSSLVQPFISACPPPSVSECRKLIRWLRLVMGSKLMWSWWWDAEPQDTRKLSLTVFVQGSLVDESHCHWHSATFWYHTCDIYQSGEPAPLSPSPAYPPLITEHSRLRLHRWHTTLSIVWHWEPFALMVLGLRTWPDVGSEATNKSLYQCCY